MTSSSEQNLSLRALIALVVGSMVGSGIFALPAAFGRATGGLGALIAWSTAGVGHADAGFRLSNTLAKKTRIGCRNLRLCQSGLRQLCRLRVSHGLLDRVLSCRRRLSRLDKGHLRTVFSGLRRWHDARGDPVCFGAAMGRTHFDLAGHQGSGGALIQEQRSATHTSLDHSSLGD